MLQKANGIVAVFEFVHNKCFPNVPYVHYAMPQIPSCLWHDIPQQQNKYMVSPVLRVCSLVGAQLQ
jgi:hypothetical protein